MKRKPNRVVIVIGVAALLAFVLLSEALPTFPIWAFSLTGEESSLPQVRGLLLWVPGPWGACRLQPLLFGGPWVVSLALRGGFSAV